jgi:hypothetical protein
MYRRVIETERRNAGPGGGGSGKSPPIAQGRIERAADAFIGLSDMGIEWASSWAGGTFGAEVHQ